MSWLMNAEELIELMQPVLGALRSAKGFLKRNPGHRAERAIGVPDRTLEVTADQCANPMHWDLARHGMRLSGRILAANTSTADVRITGARLLEPAGVHTISTRLRVREPGTGRYRARRLIRGGTVGEVDFTLLVTPAADPAGGPVLASLALLDQFANAHALHDLEFTYSGDDPSSETRGEM